MAAPGGSIVCDGDVCRFVPGPGGTGVSPPAASATVIESMLGDTLSGHGGNSVSTSSVTGAGGHGHESACMAAMDASMHPRLKWRGTALDSCSLPLLLMPQLRNREEEEDSYKVLRELHRCIEASTTDHRKG